MRTKAKLWAAAGLIPLYLMVSACSSSTGAKLDLSGATITGQVTAVSGREITLSLSGSSGDPGMGPGSSGQDGTAPGAPPGGTGDQGGAPPAAPPGSGDQSGGTAGGSDPAGTPPAMPSDDATAGTSDGSDQGGTPPAMPSGDATGGTSDGSTVTLTINDASLIKQGDSSAELSDIQVGDTLSIAFDSSGTITSVTIASSSTSSSAGNNGATADDLKSGTYSSKTYSSTNADENAARVSGDAEVTLTNATINKAGDSSSTEDSDFYGLNAGLLVTGGGVLTTSGGTVTTDAAGANAVFVNGSSSSADLTGTTIRTSSNNSGGIDVTGGGTITASGLDVETQGNSSAAIRSDRGGGTITADGGTYVTHGTGSPAIYSTADITTKKATLTSTGSEVVVIEGANSVTIEDTTATGNMSSSVGAHDNLHAVMIYQSMSGDAEVGHGQFSMTGGSLTAQTGDVFYVTNTTASIALSGVAITGTDSGNLLTVSGNDASRGWGTAGSNGGTCTLDATGQTLSGSIVVDSISSLALNITDGSAFTGTINTTGAAGDVDVTLSDSTWTLTGDSSITGFTGDLSSIVTNGHHVFLNGTLMV